MTESLLWLLIIPSLYRVVFYLLYTANNQGFGHYSVTIRGLPRNVDANPKRYTHPQIQLTRVMNVGEISHSQLGGPLTVDWLDQRFSEKPYSPSSNRTNKDTQVHHRNCRNGYPKWWFAKGISCHFFSICVELISGRAIQWDHLLIRINKVTHSEAVKTLKNATTWTHPKPSEPNKKNRKTFPFQQKLMTG